VNANVNDGRGGLDECSRGDERRPWKVAQVELYRHNQGGAQAESDRMAAWVAGFSLPRWVVVVLRRRVLVLVGYRALLVGVSCQPVMMRGVIVFRVLVHMHRRCRGG
jgi:hypothetical protein